MPPVRFGLSQPSPELHGVAPWQQGCPEPPHASHVPAPASLRPWQTTLLPPWQLPPPQQAWPDAPQVVHVPLLPKPFGLSQPSPELQA